MIRILFLGDIVGEPGRSAVMKAVPVFLKERGVDFVIVNGENAAGGRGITGRITIDLLRSGVAVITTGDHIWDQRETATYISTEPRLLRPINYPVGAPGEGSLVLETAKGKVAVVNLQGRTFMQPILDNPFPAARPKSKIASGNTGYHRGHARRNDERKNCHGTIAGRKGLGGLRDPHPCANRRRAHFTGWDRVHLRCRDVRPRRLLPRSRLPTNVKRFLDGLPGHFPVAAGQVRLCGAIVDVDEASGKTIRIARVNELSED